VCIKWFPSAWWLIAVDWQVNPRDVSQRELLGFRLAIYKALCLLDQGKYGTASKVLKTIEEVNNSTTITLS
jgi:hypothetical protein